MRPLTRSTSRHGPCHRSGGRAEALSAAASGARGGVRCRGPRGAGRTRAAPRGCTCAGRTGGRRRHSRYSSAPWQSSSGSRAPDRARQPPCIGRALRRTDTRHRPIASPGRCPRRGNAGGPRPPPQAGISRRCADARFAGVEGAVREPGRRSACATSRRSAPRCRSARPPSGPVRCSPRWRPGLSVSSRPVSLRGPSARDRPDGEAGAVVRDDTGRLSMNPDPDIRFPCRPGARDAGIGIRAKLRGRNHR